ncbi:hypothetical protein [Xenophilus azovorans]|uniref:hypothetical protein n=1 Tax=Xenophilus azovorans TaxID=151755 RepID=UPI000571BB58|nr:hypothetical protein [Xenophilus azovorans]
MNHSNDNAGHVAEYIGAELLTELALDANGQPFPDDPEHYAQEDAADLQPVALGPVRFRVLDADARELAEALGAVDPAHPDGAKLLVELHPDEPEDALVMGSYVNVEAASGVVLTFLIWCSTFDRDAPIPPEFDLGEGATRNAALASLGPRQALLIQAFADHEEAPEARQQAVAALQGVVLHIMNRMGVGDTPFDAEEATALRLALDGDLCMPTLQQIAERDAELAGALARVVEVIGGAA